jgi:hypothetical protein
MSPTPLFEVIVSHARLAKAARLNRETREVDAFQFYTVLCELDHIVNALRRAKDCRELTEWITIEDELLRLAGQSPPTALANYSPDAAEYGFRRLQKRALAISECGPVQEPGVRNVRELVALALDQSIPLSREDAHARALALRSMSSSELQQNIAEMLTLRTIKRRLNALNYCKSELENSGCVEALEWLKIRDELP